jgi:hypothetical protein
MRVPREPTRARRCARISTARECKCLEGFEMAGTECKAIKGNRAILFPRTGQIDGLDIVKRPCFDVILGEEGFIDDVDYDPVNEVVYWVNS